jgi:GT2 family glycosyltransferase
LNVGFARSRGDYLTWTSDDNLYEPNALEEMVRCLQSHSEWGLVYCDMRQIGPDGEDLGASEATCEPEALIDRNCVGACFLYRREVYRVIGDYATDMVLVEDYEYWLRVSRRFRMVRVAGPALYRYRIHPGSLTSRRLREVRVNHVRAQCRHVIPPSQSRRILFDAYWRDLWECRKAGELRLAWRWAVQCVRLRPFRLTHWKVALSTGLRLLASDCFPHGPSIAQPDVSTGNLPGRAS